MVFMLSLILGLVIFFVNGPVLQPPYVVCFSLKGAEIGSGVTMICLGVPMFLTASLYYKLFRVSQKTFRIGDVTNRASWNTIQKAERQISIQCRTFALLYAFFYSPIVINFGLVMLGVKNQFEKGYAVYAAFSFVSAMSYNAIYPFVVISLNGIVRKAVICRLKEFTFLLVNGQKQSFHIRIAVDNMTPQNRIIRQRNTYLASQEKV